MLLLEEIVFQSQKDRNLYEAVYNALLLEVIYQATKGTKITIVAEI